jgi:hypothetical protein
MPSPPIPASIASEWFSEIVELPIAAIRLGPVTAPFIYEVRLQTVGAFGQLSSWVTLNVGAAEGLPVFASKFRISGLGLVGKGNDTTNDGSDFNYSWRVNTPEIGSAMLNDLADRLSLELNADPDAPSPVFREYRIRTIDLSTGVTIRTDFEARPRYSYKMSMNAEDHFGRANRTHKIGVSFVDILGNVGPETQFQAQNDAPLVPNDITYASSDDRVFASSSLPRDGDFAGLQLHASDTPGFTPSKDSLVADGSKSPLASNQNPGGVTAGSTVYVRLIPYDIFAIDTV